MKTIASVLVAVCGLSVAANAQLLKMLVSTDGVNFSSSVNAYPGVTVQVLVTASYTGTSTAVSGFGSANFQPTVSNWYATDTLLPLRQGGNTLPADGSGVVQPQFYTGTTTGDGTHVSAGYVPGTYGRVNPMGRTYLDGVNALTGFVNVNPDGSGQTYLRIAQATAPMWFGQPGNTSGGSGVNAAQLYVVGRTTSDPDFWGNHEVNLVDPSDPSAGWDIGTRIAANDVRRTNVELFRFAFTLDSNHPYGDMVIDAPLAGQQIDPDTQTRYIGYYNNQTDAQPGLHLPVVVQTGVVHYIPGPATFALLGLGGLAGLRRRRSF